MVGIGTLLDENGRVLDAVVKGVGTVVIPREIASYSDVPDALRPAGGEAGPWIMRLGFSEEANSAAENDWDGAMP
jgi:hypothetical protein